jgi:hypothetical protein
MRIEDLVIPLLIVCVLLVCVLAVLQLTSWLMHNSVANRVTALEARSTNNVTHTDTKEIYERLSSLEAHAGAQAISLKAIENFLLEKKS